MNQLMSRVEDGATPFQFALAELMNRIFKQHPYHSLHHLFAASRAPRGSAADDATAQSRYRAAQAIQRDMAQEPAQKKFLERVFQADHRYKALADNAPEMNRGGNKVRLKDFPSAYQVASSIPKLRLPPITITLPLKPSADYSDAPYVVEFDGYCTVMGGLSAPKVLKARASDGKWYRELFKSGRDDLRQDAIMEQVFEEVSKMLSNHKATRQRDLKVRTYKVIPLAKTSGVIEFVPNSMPINDFLRPAHKKYYPKDLAENKARDMVDAAHKTGSLDTRLRRFREICDRLHPVLRHFFFERFNDPDEWFEKRTAYTRTTASVSILGHILGLGDRHCSNILIDEKTGEVVHIDLGVAFEAGRVLQIPEVIPFRLTRDIVDGMGATGTEGVFRRCCEFTMDAVREDKDSIMTLLNVLKYDPLYEWTMSPLRAKRMQEAQDINLQGGDIDEPSSKKTEQAAGEAERALAIVEKKLEKTLSTTATINELIQQATDEKNLAVLFMGWAAFF
jgi:ataxia telangiectasia mutated family protein